MFLPGLRISPNLLIDLQLAPLLITQSGLLGYYVLLDHRLALFHVHQRPYESRLWVVEGVVRNLFVKILATLEMVQLKT